MKKRLLALLTLSLVILSLVSCSFDLSSLKDNDQEDADTENGDLQMTDTYAGLNITIPEGFKKYTYNGYELHSEDMLIRIMATAKSSITPNEGYDFPTITEFFDTMRTFKDEVTYANKDGYLYTDYHTTQDNIAYIFAITETEGTQTIFFLENDDYFWAIAFYSSTMEYEAAKARAFELIGCFEMIEE